MTYDYTKLKHKMLDKKLTQEATGALIGIKAARFSMKMNSQMDFKQSEILALCKLLGIPSTQVNSYFFTLEVQ